MSIVLCTGVRRAPRRPLYPRCRSEASVAASRALFILASSEDGEVAGALRAEGGMQPCTMLLTAGPAAESSLWACTLLGLLADGHAEVQEEIAEVSRPQYRSPCSHRACVHAATVHNDIGANRNYCYEFSHHSPAKPIRWQMVSNQQTTLRRSIGSADEVSPGDSVGSAETA